MIKSLVGIILMLFCVQSFAQRTDSSPYSSLGIGNEVASKTIEEMSMGGVGTANATGRLGFSNPASYSYLRYTTYTLAAENRAYWFKDDNGIDNTSNAYLSYLGFGIPLGEKAGFAFGMQLNSTIGYEITENTFDENEELIQAALYKGIGGTNRVFFGLGYEFFDGFSLGLEGKYIFGKTESSVIEQLRDISLATKYKTDASANGFGLKAGLLYKKEIKDGLVASFGTSIEFENDLDFTAKEYLYSVLLGGVEIPRDTILNLKTTGVYKTPLKTNLGVSLGKSNKWSASVDYSFRDAIDISGNLVGNNPKLAYGSYNKLSFGGFYIPRHNSISSYWQRVSYRAGIRLENSGILVDISEIGTDYTEVKDFGISFGLGLPVGRGFSKLDTSLEYGQRGTTANGLTKENYFNFRIGLAFGDKWFIKRGIN